MKKMLKRRNSKQRNKDSSGGKEKPTGIIGLLKKKKKQKIAVDSLHLLPGSKKKAWESTKKFWGFFIPLVLY